MTTRSGLVPLVWLVVTAAAAGAPHHAVAGPVALLATLLLSAVWVRGPRATIRVAVPGGRAR